MDFSFKSGFRTTGVQPQIMNILTTDVPITECRNILCMPKGFIAPRSQANLKKLHAYVRRKFKTNMYDGRTKAYRYMRQHDSEFLRSKKVSGIE